MASVSSQWPVVSVNKQKKAAKLRCLPSSICLLPTACTAYCLPPYCPLLTAYCLLGVPSGFGAL